MNLHNVRYIFEHHMLPQWFFENKMGLVGGILKDKTILFKIIDDIFKQEQVENPYEPEQFDAQSGRIAEDVFFMKITFPTPEDEPLCYCSYMFFDEEFEKISYFCIEKGNSFGEELPFVCSWTSDGAHLNHGNCTFEENDDFLRCASLHMNRFYGENDGV